MNTNKKQYYENTFGQEDSTLLKIRKKAEQEGIEYMSLSPADAHILQCLTQMSKAKKQWRWEDCTAVPLFILPGGYSRRARFFH